MTRKDFELIAETILAMHVEEKVRLQIAENFARALKSTNAGFKTERFIEAATVGKKTVRK